MLPDILRLLTQIVIVLIFIGLALRFVPTWILGAVGLVLVLSLDILDKKAVDVMVEAAKEPIALLLPVLILFATFRFLAAGGFNKKR